MTESYDVLRLIEHNRVCYVSSDNVKGNTLVQWLKYHPVVPKETLFQWVKEILRQLQQIHKCRGNPCYQYVNPYSMIIAEDGSLYYLDVKAESNAEQVRIMQRRMMREHFLPPEEPYYQRSSVELDIYGVGKSLQYLLAFSETEPCLTRQESARFQRIIQKCLKYNSNKSFKSVSEILRRIPEQKIKTEYGKYGKWFLLAGTVIFVLIFSGHRTEKEETNEETIEVIRDDEKEQELYRELGRVYFQYVQDYEKSAEYFLMVKEDSVAENMAVIASALNSADVDAEKVHAALEKVEENISEEDYGKYLLCLLRSYAVLETDEVTEDVIRIGEKGIELVQEERGEIYGYLAHAYELGDQKEKAIEMYTLLLGQEEQDSLKTGIYKKIVELYLQMEEREKAQEALNEAIELYPEETAFRIQLLKIQCQDTAVDRAICAQTAREQIAELPKLKEEEEFQKLLSEYGISLEG